MLLQNVLKRFRGSAEHNSKDYNKTRLDDLEVQINDIKRLSTKLMLLQNVLKDLGGHSLKQLKGL